MAPPKKTGTSGGFKKSGPARPKSGPSKGKPVGKRFVDNATSYATRKAFDAAVDAVGSSPIVSAVKKAFFIGLGASAVSGEKIKALADDLLKQGWLADHDVNEFVSDLKTRAQKEAGSLKEGASQLQGQVQNQLGQISEAALTRIIDSLGLVRQRDLAQLRAELTATQSSATSYGAGRPRTGAPRSSSPRSGGSRPPSARPSGARPSGDRAAAKPYGEKSYGDKPTGERSAYGRKPGAASASTGSGPSRKPGGFKPSGSRPARPGGAGGGKPYRKPS